MGTIERLEPNVLISLAEEILPFYREGYEEYASSFLVSLPRYEVLVRFAHLVIYGVVLARAPLEYMPDDLIRDNESGSPSYRLRCAVYRWGKRWHIDWWILNYAVGTLNAWYESKLIEPKWVYSPLPDPYFPPVRRPFRF